LEEALVPGVHPEGHLGLAPVAAEMPLPDQHPDQQAEVEPGRARGCFTVVHQRRVWQSSPSAKRGEEETHRTHRIMRWMAELPPATDAHTIDDRISTRLTVYIKPDLARRLVQFKERLNMSKICQDALEAAATAAEW